MTGFNGIVVVNKEKDWTSFDVVAKLRGIFHEKRIGHGGTLDPMATGVLPVLVGKSARACDILPVEEKAYKAGFELGITTDTLDITGKVLSQKKSLCTKSEIVEVSKKFVGDIMQIPPMYSAVKVGGKKLYSLAREGKVIERQPRPVTVMELEILSFDEETQKGSMFVRCKKGTYIRSIIDDMGNALGVGAVMTDLQRTSSSGFDIENSYTISQIERLADEGKLETILLSVDEAFSKTYKSRVTLNERLTALYKNGVKLTLGQEGMEYKKSSGEILVYGFDGEFLGLAGELDGVLKSTKNFY